MSDVKVISPDRLKKARGKNSRRAVVNAGKEQFTEQDLYNWESGKNLPHPKKLPYLLKALDVSFDDIAIDVRRSNI